MSRFVINRLTCACSTASASCCGVSRGAISSRARAGESRQGRSPCGTQRHADLERMQGPAFDAPGDHAAADAQGRELGPRDDCILAGREQADQEISVKKRPIESLGQRRRQFIADVKQRRVRPR
ncbi:MAG: hypothetical protein M3376_01075 [Actinomycetota bacterium]|nr:hypothetical protein [Actinomycetota bacterium]